MGDVGRGLLRPGDYLLGGGSGTGDGFGSCGFGFGGIDPAEAGLVVERWPFSQGKSPRCLIMRDKPSINAGNTSLNFNSCLTDFGFHESMFLAFALE